MDTLSTDSIGKSIPITRYLNTRTANFPFFSSDGRSLVFLTDITGTPQVWRVDIHDDPFTIKWPEQLTFDADRVMGVWCSPAPGDERLIYTRDIGGNEKAQLYLLSPSTGKDIPLSEGFVGAMHLFGDWTPDGGEILFAANRRDPALFDLYKMKLDGETSLVWRNDQPGFLADITLSPDEKRVALTRTSSSFQHDLLEIDLAIAEARTLSLSQSDTRYFDLCYTKDGKGLYLTTDLESDYIHIRQLDLDNLHSEVLVSPQGDVDVMACSPNGHSLAYAVNEEGVSKLKLFDISSGLIRNAPHPGISPGVVAWFDFRLRFSGDSKRLAYSYSSASRTSDIYLWDLSADRSGPVTRSSHGGIPTSIFIDPRIIHYPTFDEDENGQVRKIPAWFYQPENSLDDPVPAIVVVHGGPESEFRPYFNFLIQYFIHKGYAVLAPNVRGSTGYGKAYSHLDDGEKRMDSVADLAHAAYWLKSQPGIDGNSLVVYGGSYGGFMVLSSLTTYPELWAAGVDIVGISNFVTFLENTSDYRRAHREAEYGSLADLRDFLEQISPLNQVDRIQAPLMVIHGANDPRVPLSEAEQLVEVLETRGVPVKFLVFDDEGHGIAKLKNKQVAYPAIADFLANHL